jgi:hypothetical protein
LIHAKELSPGWWKITKSQLLQIPTLGNGQVGVDKDIARLVASTDAAGPCIHCPARLEFGGTSKGDAVGRRSGECEVSAEVDKAEDAAELPALLAPRGFHRRALAFFDRLSGKPDTGPDVEAARGGDGTPPARGD